ncbi:MAG TPA: SseB family protein [Pseudolysinimonas sp.]|jgi:hypothetical protein
MAEDDADTGEAQQEEPPLTLFESAILEAKRGLLPIDELARAFWDTELAVPSMEPPTGDITALAPAMFQIQEFPAVAVFSHERRAATFAQETGTPYLLLATGRQLASVMNPQVGVILNPRSERYFVIFPPEALAAARKSFGG